MTWLKLFANCRITEGYTRDIITDLEKERFFLVPKSLSAMLSGTLDESSFNEGSREVLEEYYSFLIANELAFIPEPGISYLETIEKFGDTYSEVNNITWILDRDMDETMIAAVAARFNDLGVQGILLIAKPRAGIGDMTKVLSTLAVTSAFAIEIMLEYSDMVSMEMIRLAAAANPRVQSVVIYAAAANIAGYLNDDRTVVCYQTVSEFSQLFDKPVQQYHFVSNVRFFNESLHCNPFYYRKLFIDHRGALLTHPLGEDIWGWLTSQDIHERLPGNEACKIGQVVKTVVDICKNCEFRNICPDNRIPLQRSDKSWYHIKECHYNPFLGKWKGEATYRSLSQCGITSNEKGFSIEMDRLIQATKEIIS